MMDNNSRIITPKFSSPDEKISYLERKVSFLLKHAERLADKKTAQGQINIHSNLTELHNIKNSLSWRITKPLRQLNRIMKIWKRKNGF